MSTCDILWVIKYHGKRGHFQLYGHAVHIYSVSKQLSRVSNSAPLLPDNICSHKSPRDDPGDVTQTQKTAFPQPETEADRNKRQSNKYF